MFYAILLELSRYSPIIPVIIGLAVIKEISLSMKIILLYVSGSLLIDIIGLEFKKVGINNLPVVLSFTLYEGLLLFFFFNSIRFNNQKLKSIWRIIYVILILLVVYLLFFSNNGFTSWNPKATSIRGLTMVVSSIFYFMDLSLYSDVKESQLEGIFFVVAAILTYYALVTGIYSALSEFDKAQQRTLWSFKLSAFILFNIVIAYGIYTEYKLRKWDH